MHVQFIDQLEPTDIAETTLLLDKDVLHMP